MRTKRVSQMPFWVFNENADKECRICRNADIVVIHEYDNIDGNQFTFYWECAGSCDYTATLTANIERAQKFTTKETWVDCVNKNLGTEDASHYIVWEDIDGTKRLVYYNSTYDPQFRLILSDLVFEDNY